MSVRVPQQQSRHVAWWAGVAIVAAAGVYVRLREVGSLHLILDERLVLRSITRGSLFEDFVRHTMGNNSPPLTMYARILADLGALDELTLRLPMLASGVLLLGLPLLLLPRIGRTCAIVHLALMATSPALAYFSFVARPYAPTLLAIAIALLAADRNSRGGGWGASLLFGIASSVAVFLHPFAAPVVAAPFIAGAIRAHLGRERWRPFVRASICATVSGLVLMAPSAQSFVSQHFPKAGREPFSPRLVVATFEGLAGLGNAGAALLALFLALGLWVGWRRLPRLVLVTALAPALIMLSLALSRPLGGVNAWTRYALLAWPHVLFLVALGFTYVIELATAKRPELRESLAAAGAVLLVAGVLALSPLRLFRQAPDSFRSHPNALAPLGATDVPTLYTKLAADPEVGDTLLECPDPGIFVHSAPYSEYQREHRKRVMLLSPGSDRFSHGFRNSISLQDTDRLRASGARYAVVHVDLRREIFPDAPSGQPNRGYDACREALRDLTGLPVYGDGQLELYDLHRSP